MACNSIATTRATIGNVVLSREITKEMLKALVPNLREMDVYQNDGSVWTYVNGDSVRITSDERGVTLTCDDQATSDKLLPLFDRLLIVAQQKAVIGRLAQLGKLSQVKGRDGGVTMRLEIDTRG